MSARDEPPHFRQRERGGGRTHSRSPRRDRRDDRERDRDRGYAQVKREPDTGYGARERERERKDDRQRYDEDSGEPKSPPKPDFSSSGLLAKESNQVKGVALKYHEPPEARKPTQNWRLYVFKGEEQVDLIHVYTQSCFLVGRDAVVADIHVLHPSCSKQHAVLQFRAVSKRSQYGDATSDVKPYILDLDSTNGTYVNGQEVPKSRYYELRVNDVLKFGTSAREYVLLHEDAGK
ncbi:hypothetical protein CspHIS471_0702290 [Cutaneotrichosporon sp. HIS471]|nr:hypothetical protein CspHIS471_0702290 [Cutaneotrichosporon sp. HIS471]